MKLDPVSRLFPKTTFVILNMGFPLMNEAWSLHHDSKNVYLHLGGEGIHLSGPAMGYVNMGAGGFIPLDSKRVLFGSAFSENLLTTSVVCESKFHMMGLSWDQAVKANPVQLYGE